MFFRICRVHKPIHKDMAAHTEISKKSFKERCDMSHTYKGDRSRINTIYFDWQETPEGRGFKCAVAMDTRNGTKAELLDILYHWICQSEAPPWYVRYKYANEDKDRFKCPICLNF